MFRCKVMAFRILDFYIGLLEHFKMSKSLRGFEQNVEVWGHFFYWFIDSIIKNIF